MNKSFFLKILLTVLIAAAFFEKTLACRSEKSTVCENYARAAAVVTGEVVSFTKNRTVQNVVVKVKKIYKGAPAERIIVNQPLHSCELDLAYLKGQTVLLYLLQTQQAQTYQPIFESIDGDVRTGSNELYWLDNLPKSLGRTKISGTVERYQDVGQRYDLYWPGFRLKISGEQQSFEVVTDDHGVFEVWDVPPGKYRITPEIPDRYVLWPSRPLGKVEYRPLVNGRPNWQYFSVDIDPAGCGGAEFIIRDKLKDQ